MARRKADEINIRSLMVTAGGSSFMMTLPIQMIRELEWQNGEKLSLKLKGDKIIVQKFAEPVEVPVAEVKPKKKKKKKKKKKAKA